MPGFFDSLTTLINSPPVFGAALAGTIWKTFKYVGDLLNEQTNRHIAHWLRVKYFESGIVAAESISWSATFLALFDTLFKTATFSWRGFLRSLLVTICSNAIGWLIILRTIIAVVRNALGMLSPLHLSPTKQVVSVGVGLVVAFGLNTSVLSMPDYLCYLTTRRIIAWANTTKVPLISLFLSFIVACVYTVIVTILLAAGIFLLLQTEVGIIKHHNPALTPNTDSVVSVTAQNYGTANQLAYLVCYFPLFFVVVFLALYLSGGFILKAARTFDIGFDLFASTVDIDKKPLQSIGLVAGALVALIYWTAAIIRHFWR
jgi:hypothetical protein